MKTNPVAILILRLTAVFVLLVLNSGCASHYLGHRGRDAADILTLTFGVGSGAKVRLGPLQLAAFENTDLVGLRAGQGFLLGADLTDNHEAYSIFPVFRGEDWSDPVAVDAFTYGKHTVEEHRSPDIYVHDRPHFMDWSAAFGREIFRHDIETPARYRDKRSLASAPLPFLARSPDPEFYSQVEIAVGLAFSLRLGFNPGELVDFLLGLGGIDIYGDDVSPPAIYR